MKARLVCILLAIGFGSSGCNSQIHTDELDLVETAVVDGVEVRSDDVADVMELRHVSEEEAIRMIVDKTKERQPQNL